MADKGIAVTSESRMPGGPVLIRLTRGEVALEFPISDELFADPTGLASYINNPMRELFEAAEAEVRSRG